MPSYCHNCGKNVEPLWKFCAYCQTSLSSLKSSPLPNQATVIMAIDDEDGDSNYLDRLSHYTPKVHQLEIDFQEEIPNKETLGQMATSPFGYSSAETTIKPNINVPQKSREEVLREFQREVRNHQE